MRNSDTTCAPSLANSGTDYGKSAPPQLAFDLKIMRLHMITKRVEAHISIVAVKGDLQRKQGAYCV